MRQPGGAGINTGAMGSQDPDVAGTYHGQPLGVHMAVRYWSSPWELFWEPGQVTR